MKRKMKLLRVYSPIERVDATKREVEGYCFVNETVDGEGGIKLKRSTMIAATDDYMQFANVREMHDKKAAGNVLDIKWDAKGCLIRTKITDDQAWKKVEAGTYKGFSVGVRAQVMRGLSVEKAKWLETSLVDRPADPDARFTLVRADGFTDATVEEEYEVEDLERSDDTDKAKGKGKKDKKKDLGRGAGDPPANDGEMTIERGKTLLIERAGLIQRAETAEAELVIVRAKLLKREAKVEKLKARVSELEGMPAIKPPVRYPQALQRTFAANDAQGEGAPDQAEVTAKYKEYQQFLVAAEERKNDPIKNREDMGTLQLMQSELRELGLDV